MEEPAAVTESSETPLVIQNSPLDFANENPSQEITEGDGTKDQAHETVIPKIAPPQNAPTTKVAPIIILEEENATDAPLINKRRRKRSTLGRKSTAATNLEAGSSLATPASQEGRDGTINPDSLSYAKPQPAPEQEIASSKEAAVAWDPGNIYQHEWGVTNGCRLDTSEACQDLVDHLAPPEYFSELRHLPNEDFLSQYNINLVKQVAMGSQLRLRFEQEARLLKKSVAQVARRDQRIQAMESLRTQFTDLQVSNEQLSQQVSTLQGQVLGEEKIMASIEEFKKYEDNRVVGHGLRLAVMKCAESLELRQAFANVITAGITKVMSEGLEYGVKYGGAKLDLALEKLRDAPLDLIMASLHLESDTGEDTPQWIRDLRPSSSQLKIPVYPEVRDPKDPWAFKEEILLEDAIVANVSRVEKKKKCRVGLAILLEDAATQTDVPEDEASPKLIRSKSLLALYNLDWP
ncbi:hypothetical protein Tco_0800704 [Tanacetum coccineum]|uniref:Uncharacterized protein n=1 Tax=Tanacetum coccineum TaxID=301880 RepID=A0ABQ4ZWK8_9ASTR